MNFTGFLAEKMTTTVQDAKVQYNLNGIALNEVIGKPFRLTFTGKTQCLGCGKHDVDLTDGHCDDCQMTLAKCDLCRVKPELCHYEEGTCREPSWGEENCLTPHTLYISNTSGVKIGITRDKNVADLSRWIDQGATQALPILQVSNRLTAGQIEIAIAKVMADKTNWRTMLTGNGDAIDLKALAADLTAQFKTEFALYGDRVLNVLDAEVVDLSFPVKTFPAKVGNAFNVKKNPTLSGVLVGIKGQYIMVQTSEKVEVLNLRKYGGYEVELAV